MGSELSCRVALLDLDFRILCLNEKIRGYIGSLDVSSGLHYPALSPCYCDPNSATSSLEPKILDLPSGTVHVHGESDLLSGFSIIGCTYSRSSERLVQLHLLFHVSTLCFSTIARRLNRTEITIILWIL